MSGSPAVSSDLRLTAPPWEKLVEHSPQVKTFEQDPNWATGEFREKFGEFVAGTFFKAMIAAMRKTVGETKLIHGGRAEEIFRSQLDDTLATRLANQSGDDFSGKMFQQFLLNQAGASTQGQAPENGFIQNLVRPDQADAGGLADHTF